jgi:hypothetical protein
VGLVFAGGLGLSGRVALATAPAAEVVASLSGWLPEKLVPIEKAPHPLNS